jgi:hypothetical protein
LIGWLFIVRGEARTYLRGKGGGKGNSKRKGRSRFPEGMTERKARATATAKTREEADPCGMTPRNADATARANEEADSHRE